MISRIVGVLNWVRMILWKNYKFEIISTMSEGVWIRVPALVVLLSSNFVLLTRRVQQITKQKSKKSTRNDSSVYWVNTIPFYQILSATLSIIPLMSVAKKRIVQISKKIMCPTSILSFWLISFRVDGIHFTIQKIVKQAMIA